MKITKQANNAGNESISTDAKVYVCSEQHLISLQCCFGTEPRNQIEIEISRFCKEKVSIVGTFQSFLRCFNY